MGATAARARSQGLDHRTKVDLKDRSLTLELDCLGLDFGADRKYPLSLHPHGPCLAA